MKKYNWWLVWESVALAAVGTLGFFLGEWLAGGAFLLSAVLCGIVVELDASLGKTLEDNRRILNRNQKILGWLETTKCDYEAADRARVQYLEMIGELDESRSEIKKLLDTVVGMAVTYDNVDEINTVLDELKSGYFIMSGIDGKFKISKLVEDN